MIAVTTENFDEVVLKSDKPVLVDFWAEWCGPCKTLEPILEEIAQEYGDRLTVVKVNADENPDLAARYEVLALPTLNLFSGGQVVQQIRGAKPKRLLLEDLEGHI